MFHRNFDIAATLILSLFITSGVSRPVQEIAEPKRRVFELNDSYDYIVVGGGTSSLTVADRLSADGTSKETMRMKHNPSPNYTHLILI
jgi:hypothetical protein